MFKKLFAIVTVLVLFISTFVAIKKDINKEIKEESLKDQQYRNIVVDKSRKSIFIPTANMNMKRYSHSSVLLPNGKVLIIGGDGAGSKSNNSAELYDPKTQTFSYTGNLNFGESPFFNPSSAILLPSGKVVILHSYYVEIYDPVLSKFYPAGHLYMKRRDYGAALMPDGRILIAGGRTFEQYNKGYGTALSSAEIYNPYTKISTLTGSLNLPRFANTAITLKNQKVLIVGGQDSGDKQTKSELYDLKSGEFSIAAEMLASRYSFTTTLLSDGRVLVAGGIEPTYNYNHRTKKRTNSLGGLYAEIYDPRTNKFIKTGDMTTPRTGHSTLLLPNNKVLIVGGNKIGVVSTAEIYNPKTNKFMPTGSMHYRVSDLQASLINNVNVLVTGGIDYNYDGPEGHTKDSDKAELYIP